MVISDRRFTSGTDRNDTDCSVLRSGVEKNLIRGDISDRSFTSGADRNDTDCSVLRSGAEKDLIRGCIRQKDVP